MTLHNVQIDLKVVYYVAVEQKKAFEDPPEPGSPPVLLQELESIWRRNDPSEPRRSETKNAIAHDLPKTANGNEGRLLYSRN